MIAVIGEVVTSHAGIDLVIFDCDGVLINSEPIASATLATMLQRAGAIISAEEAHRKFTGYSLPDIRLMCVQEYGLNNIDAVFSEWNELLFEEFQRSLTPMAGILDVVAGVSCHKCVGSNSSTERLKRSLGLTPLWKNFDPYIFSADMVARPKPFPDLLLFAAQQFSARPSHTIMIDDSAHGIEAALSAGMHAIGFVDPADPRPDRENVLLQAGAKGVAMGAADLSKLMEACKY